MPNASNFDSANDYYRTLFHELIHSTGHQSRLNRVLNTNHKSEAYAKEELTAEMGAVFLSAWAGILWYNNKNHAAYLKSWNNAIKEAENDSKFIMRAAAAAQKATDHILNLDANGQPAFLSQYEKPKKKEEPKSPTPPTAPKPTKKAPAARSKKAPRAAQYTGVKTIPLSDLYTDEKRFQNRSYILNLSWLNPKGATMSTLVQFSQTQSKADKAVSRKYL